MNSDIAQQHIAQASRFNARFFYMAMDLCNTCDLQYRETSNKQFVVELTLIKLCQLMGGTPVQQPAQPRVQKVTAPAPSAPVAQAQPAQPAQPVAQAQQPVKAAQPVQPAALAQSVQPSVAPVQRVMPAPARSSTSHQVQPASASRRILINKQPAASSENGPSQATHVVRNASFTSEQLVTAWQHFIQQNPKEIILLSAMSNSVPTKIDEGTYQIEVENNVQVEALSSNMNKLLQFLRDEVGNDMVSLDIKLSPKGVSTMAKTDREIVEDMRDRNPQFAQMIKDFKLSMA